MISILQAEYKKHYNDPAEEAYHMEIFLKNKDNVEKHNQKFEEGAVSYKMGLNEFSDIEYSDFSTTLEEARYKRSQTPR